MDFTATLEAQHLCILVHGLWGCPAHLKSMADELRKKHPEENLHILVAKRNSGSFTYDGIELGGERVCQEIEEELEKLARAGQEIKKLSLVGYSLGGLVARYAIGLLHSKGIFEKITPISLSTFASPHLGVRTPLKGWHNHLWNVLGARTLSASGRQLFLIDKFRNTGKPLLEVLADPESIFIKGLEKFKRRTLYANIVNDRSAVYYTTSISKLNPFENLDKITVPYVKGYEDVVIDISTAITPKESEEPKPTIYSKIAESCRIAIDRVPWIVGMILFLPFAVLAFLVNSLVQSLRSNQRIRLHEKGLAGIQTEMYRVPLLINNMREAVEDVYENLNNAQSSEYLYDGIEEAAHDEAERHALTTNEHEVDGAIDKQQHDTFTLALAPCQFRMIQALDNVGWRKYPVWIHKSSHSHAAIITRRDKPHFDEGKNFVMRHWLEEEFIL